MMEIESLQYYTNFYYNVMLFVVLIVFSQSMTQGLTSPSNLKAKKILGSLVLLFVIFYMGLRPISFFFGDMGIYNMEFLRYSRGEALNTDKDRFFEMFMQACSQIMSAQTFFLLCAGLYVVPLYLVAKKLFRDYWFYCFLMLIISFSFWGYGTNGIRNGIATSFFLLGISRSNKIFVAAWIFLAISIHKSLLLPTVCYIAVLVYDKPSIYLAFWFAAIPLSLALGTFWQNLMMQVGFGQEERLAGYLGQDQLDLFEKVETGFRFDFILYSMTGVFTGWYFIFKKKFEDVLYRHIYSVYLIANGIWILIIRSNFSNRFAYLSWFMLGVVIIYPLIKSQIFSWQHRLIGGIIAVYFFFTYVLNVILVK